MLTASRSWVRRDPPADVVAELEHEGRYGALAARLLALRGVQGAQQAESWLAKRLSDLHKPHLMAGMPVAAKRFAQAIAGRERILIHGDYDVDGSTAAALLAWFVRACAHEAVVWIPHRRIDGYGLSEASLEAVKAHQAQLMITVDCGIADGGWAQRIEQATGCTVVITDHHLPQGGLPQCTAVCNPNRPDCTYPDKALAGVGVAWKLAWATAVELAGAERLPQPLREFLLDALALVAVGTVADCAALTGENRILVHHGLGALARTANPGLRALLEQARLEGQIAAGEVGWRLGPLLNASGRVGSAMANIRLLTAPDAASARVELDAIVAENEERKRLTQLLTADLIAEAESGAARSRASLVFAGEGWHPGVVGIVASRLVEQFGKPAAVIAINEGVGKGSLRSVPSVHLGHALDACRPFLLKGGGHAMAAGLTIDPARVVDFSAAFEQHVAERVPAGSHALTTGYDAEAALAELDQEFFRQLETMGPFGVGNAEPVVQVRQATFVSRPKPFGRDGDHLRGALTDAGGGMREFLAWRAGKHIAAFSSTGVRFDLLVRPEAGRWRGELQPRLVFVDGKSV
ncbi:MAG: single-stranded-DNA-specific exonuclease RecJ [Planctomycetes bacterium]|nr:single-stranded-DNA-specific exonuclease RecJ [Planctomycetota bacterium]